MHWGVTRVAVTWLALAAQTATAAGGRGLGDDAGHAGWRTGCDVLAAAVPLITPLDQASLANAAVGPSITRAVQALRRWSNGTDAPPQLPTEETLCEAARALVSRRYHSELMAAIGIASQLGRCRLTLPPDAEAWVGLGELGGPSTASPDAVASAVWAVRHFQLELDTAGWAAALVERLNGDHPSDSAAHPSLTAREAAQLYVALTALGSPPAALDAAVESLPRVFGLAADLFSEVESAKTAPEQIEGVLRGVTALAAHRPLPDEVTSALNDLVLGTIDLLRTQPIADFEAAVRVISFLDAVAALPTVPLLLSGVTDSFRVPITDAEVEFTASDPLCSAVSNVDIEASVIASDADPDEDANATAAPVKTTLTRLNASAHRLGLPRDAVGAYVVEVGVRRFQSDTAPPRYYPSPSTFEVTVTTARLVVSNLHLTVHNGVGSAARVSQRLDYPKTASDPISLTSSDTLHLAFGVTTEEGATMSTAHQVFLELVLDATGQDVYFLANSTSDGGFTMELVMPRIADSVFLNTGGLYRATLLVGDARAYRGVKWPLGELDLQFDTPTRPHMGVPSIYDLQPQENQRQPDAEPKVEHADMLPPPVGVAVHTTIILLVIVFWWRLMKTADADSRNKDEDPSIVHVLVVGSTTGASIWYVWYSADVILATLVIGGILTGTTIANVVF
eukprot:m.468078 g.468078  ORF g.468078 m.468078 type:complete len:679 (+) comp27160_c0_seq1:153-2189(+)